MAMRKKQPLILPAIPSLTWDGGFWECTIVLPAWSGFQSRQGPYGARDSKKKSNGTTQLAISPADEDETPPTSEQIAAFAHLIAHQEIIRNKILSAVLKEFPRFRARFYEIADPSDAFPAARTHDDLRNLMGLTTVLIHPVSWEGAAYVGYEFGCAWEAEHGLGAMTHRDRIVDLGGADSAILEWIAETDAKRLQRAKRKK